MPDKRGRPSLPLPPSRRDVIWTESTRTWHAVSLASLNRWGHTLCRRSRVGGLYAFDADEYPDGPPLRDHRPICEPCLARVQKLPD